MYIVYSESLFPPLLKAAVIGIMRAVIRVIDPAAVVMGAATQDNHKEDGSRMQLDTHTHTNIRRVKDGDNAFCLKAGCVQSKTVRSKSVNNKYDDKTNRASN